MNLQSIKSYLKSHDITPISNEGGEGGPLYCLTEDQLLELVLLMNKEEADGFGEYLRMSRWQFDINSGNWRRLFTGEIRSTQELYQLYLKSKEK